MRGDKRGCNPLWVPRLLRVFANGRVCAGDAHNPGMPIKKPGHEPGCFFRAIFPCSTLDHYPDDRCNRSVVTPILGYTLHISEIVLSGC